MEIECRNCSQSWTLEPRKWRNHRFVKIRGITYRVFRCPNCNAKNLVKAKDIIKTWEREQRLGKSKRLVKRSR